MRENQKEVSCQEKSILVWLIPSRMLRMCFLNKYWVFLSFKGFWNHLLTALSQNMQPSVYLLSDSRWFFKCVIVGDGCCSEAMHVVEFDLGGLVVKEEAAECLEWEVFCLSVLFSNESLTRSHSWARTQSSDRRWHMSDCHSCPGAQGH